MLMLFSNSKNESFQNNHQVANRLLRVSHIKLKANLKVKA